MQPSYSKREPGKHKQGSASGSHGSECLPRQPASLAGVE